SSLATMADIAPTIAAIAGAAMRKSEGLDLSPAIRDPKQLIRQTLLSSAPRQAPKVGRSVRSARFRFTQWPDGSEELFDEDADPHEWNNLASAPALQAEKAELAKRLVLPGPPFKA